MYIDREKETENKSNEENIKGEITSNVVLVCCQIHKHSLGGKHIVNSIFTEKKKMINHIIHTISYSMGDAIFNYVICKRWYLKQRPWNTAPHPLCSPNTKTKEMKKHKKQWCAQVTRHSRNTYLVQSNPLSNTFLPNSYSVSLQANATEEEITGEHSYYLWEGFQSNTLFLLIEK